MSLALVIDTNSRYSDVWEPCFGQLDKLFPRSIKKYAFVDRKEEELPDKITPIKYDDLETYRNQLLSCISQVEEDYILYTSEDHILYDTVSETKLFSLVDIMRAGDVSFIKLLRGPEALTGNYDGHKDLFAVNPYDNNFFAQQAGLWKTRDFQKVFEESPPSNGRMEQEPGGSAICRRLRFVGLQCYNGEKKRGMVHYDSNTFPYIATAVVKGRWNLSEYPFELGAVLAQYAIDPHVRGTR